MGSKQHLKKEGSEVVTCHGLKLLASDGKTYKTDISPFNASDKNALEIDNTAELPFNEE